MQPEPPTQQSEYDMLAIGQPSRSPDRERVSIAPVWHTVLLIIVLGAPALTFLVRLNDDKSPVIRPIAFLVFQLVLYALMFLYIVWGLRLRKTSLLALLGKRWTSFEDGQKDLLIGVIAAVAIILVDVVLMRIGSFSHHRHRLPLQTNAQFAAQIGIMFIVGFVEELTCRGYLQLQFERWTNSPTIAMILQSTLFAVAHGGEQTLLGVLSKFISAVIFTKIAKRTGSLIPAILAHSLLDAGLVAFIWLTR